MLAHGTAMFEADAGTYDSLRKLWGLSLDSKKPILLWVGAGASSWLGYERWADLAERFHRTFLRAESAYPRSEAAADLEGGRYPAVFQHCRDTNSQRYFSLLADSFGPRQLTPVYDRFVNAIRASGHVSIATTNVDETLERTLADFELVQRSDLPRTLSLMNSKTPFVAKLHGSISAVHSTVFTTEDYENLVRDQTFMEVLRTLLITFSVVFIGYSLRDQYLFDLLARNCRLLALFGDGPHFLVTTEQRLNLPTSVNLILYRTDTHTDHRSGILAVELLNRPRAEAEPFQHRPSAVVPLQSSHFLSDFYPGGTWTTGNTLNIQRQDGRQSELLVGPNWTSGEFPGGIATAAYDLAVSLICFDRTFLPIECAGRVHQLVGSPLFWEFVTGDVLRFVHWEGYDSLMVETVGGPTGHLVTGKLDRQAMEVFRKQIQPLPGMEATAAAQFALVENKIRYVDLSGEASFASVCNGLLVSPATRRLIGLGEATPVEQIPRWAAGPVLRLVQIARIGATCRIMGIPSIKLMPGAAQVAQVAFSAVSGGVLAEEVAAYVLTGQFAVIPEAAISTPQIWRSILKFRDSSAGTNLRGSLIKHLQANEGAEIVAAVDTSLRQTIPHSVLAEARVAMSALLVASRSDIGGLPGLWSDADRLWDGAASWRSSAKTRYEEYLQQNGLGPYDLCPCGSYEKVKFCCQNALTG